MQTDRDQVHSDLQSGDSMQVRAALLVCIEQGWHLEGLLKGLDLSGLDLHGVDLQDADLTEAVLEATVLSGADLRRATLIEADLTGADLSKVDLREADMMGANLQDVNLKEARLREEQFALALGLAGATMPDGKPYDGRYQLSGDIVDARHEQVYPDQPQNMAEWYGVDQETYLEGVEWASLELADFRRAAYTMREADIYEVVDAREDGSLTDGSLRGVQLEEINLAGCDLSGAVLPVANFNGAILLRCDFSGADLSQAMFVDADMEMVNLTSATLRQSALAYADLSRSNLQKADLSGADLEGATLVEANLTGAKVTDQQLALADALAGATMADGNRYDGRYRLEGDLFNAGDSGLDTEDPEQMAAWYEIETIDYQKGQQWAAKNLSKIRATAQDS